MKAGYLSRRLSQGRYQIGGAAPDLHSLSAIFCLNPRKEKIACEKPFDNLLDTPAFHPILYTPFHPCEEVCKIKRGAKILRVARGLGPPDLTRVEELTLALPTHGTLAFASEPIYLTQGFDREGQAVATGPLKFLPLFLFSYTSEKFVYVKKCQEI